MLGMSAFPVPGREWGSNIPLHLSERSLSTSQALTFLISLLALSGWKETPVCLLLCPKKGNESGEGSGSQV